MPTNHQGHGSECGGALLLSGRMFGFVELGTGMSWEGKLRQEATSGSQWVCARPMKWKRWMVWGYCEWGWDASSLPSCLSTRRVPRHLCRKTFPDPKPQEQETQ